MRVKRRYLQNTVVFIVDPLDLCDVWWKVVRVRTHSSVHCPATI